MLLFYFALGIVSGIGLVALYLWLDSESLSDRQRAILDRAAEDLDREEERP